MRQADRRSIALRMDCAVRLPAVVFDRVLQSCTCHELRKVFRHHHGLSPAITHPAEASVEAIPTTAAKATIPILVSLFISVSPVDLRLNFNTSGFADDVRMNNHIGVAIRGNSRSEAPF